MAKYNLLLLSVDTSSYCKPHFEMDLFIERFPVGNLDVTMPATISVLKLNI